MDCPVAHRFAEKLYGNRSIYSGNGVPCSHRPIPNDTLAAGTPRPVPEAHSNFTERRCVAAVRNPELAGSPNPRRTKGGGSMTTRRSRPWQGAAIGNETELDLCTTEYRDFLRRIQVGSRTIPIGARGLCPTCGSPRNNDGGWQCAT